MENMEQGAQYADSPKNPANGAPHNSSAAIGPKESPAMVRLEQSGNVSKSAMKVKD
jgi:hypothetical protein